MRLSASGRSKIAAQEANGSAITYLELGDLSDRMRDRLALLGVKPGDRVGFWIRKSIDSLVTIFGILKVGAAYVPVDPYAPGSRNSYILADCAVSVVVVESRYKTGLLAEHFQDGTHPTVLAISSAGGGTHLRAMLDEENRRAKAPPVCSPDIQSDDLAYILYTSGSTGKPKGVQLTHQNAVSFIEWCSQTFEPTPDDRFSSHAPFHFDLSVLDIYCSIKHGATLVLIGEDLGKLPADLTRVIADMGISIWYSAPSILSLIAQFGDLGNNRLSSPRMVLFAGEIFPIVHLRSLIKLWPNTRYFNLYGPTETNVCTYYEVPTSALHDRVEPVPIGKVCSHLEGIIIDADVREVMKGAEGELCIRGAAVTPGYWNLPEQTRKAFVRVGSRQAYYRTGDIVKEDPNENLLYLGRKDRMIKKRGFRVELGEIEVCLYQHPQVREAAVVAVPDELLGMKVHAHIVCKVGARLSLIDLKTFCSQLVPGYMIPDNFSFHDTLPKTSTDKVDYQVLKAQS